MKFAALTTFVITALSVSAVPTKRAEAVDDATVLNYALTLEHLENAFYSEALAKFDAKAFSDAGLPSFARGRFSQIAEHEAAHVKFLSDALGEKAVKPCKYNFPYTDPKSFAALSQVLEGVGVSAYTGAAMFITNKDYLTAAASVLSTEARHASFVASAVNGANPWSGALDVPLPINEVYTLAAAFIVNGSCPTTNVALPVKAFPALTLGTGNPGDSVDVKYEGMSADKPAYIAFYTGLSQTVVPITNGKVTIPKDLVGQAYAVVTSDSAKAADDNTMAGPAILNIAFDENNKLFTPGSSNSSSGSSSGGSSSGSSAASSMSSNAGFANSANALVGGAVMLLVALAL